MQKLKRLIYFCTLIAIVLAALVGTQSSAFAQTFTVTPTSPGCQLLSAPAGTTPAFCDTFDKPEGIGDRSGQLNGTVWGVSRLLGSTNTGQGQYYDVSPTAIQLCGTTYSVIDPNDVQICDGQLVEAQFDQTGVTSLAMYPKQPFDISGGRTGTIAFDVSNDSHGGHSVWPELWYVDKPVPTPFVHDTSLISVPANGFGVQLAGTCPANSGGGCGARFVCPEYPESVPVVTISAAWVINNYVSTEVDAFSSQPSGTFTVTPVECVQASSGPGNMNHFELRVSQNEIDVYGIDAGATGPLKKIGVIANAGLTIATGLVFMEDNHYNANKTSNGQGTHTFTWDNFAFDGPVLPRDLAFDVLDRLTPVGPGYPGLLNTGWGFGGFDQSPLPPPLTLTVPGVYNVADATAAFLTFNFIDFNYANLQSPNPFISYSVNNGATQLAPFPFGACGTQNGGPACSSDYTIAVPVNLSDLVTGTNTITLTATDGAAIANVDLILHGAGGIPCTTGCPATLPSPTITITPSASSITNAQGLTVAVSVAGSGTSAPVPTGTVTLSEVGYASAPITLSSGKASISIPAGSLPAGPDLLTVSYSGDSNYAFASNNSSVTVSSVQPVAGNASLELSTSAYPSITTAQPLTLLVDLYGNGFLAPLTVTGTVTVTGGGYSSGTVPLSGGLATISIPAGALAVGNDTFAVNYSGDGNYAADDYTNQLTITVTGTGTTPPPVTTPTLTVTPSSLSITTAQPLTVAVGVAGSGSAATVPTGTVTLSGGGVTAQTVTLNSTGSASFTIPAGSLTVGGDTLRVSYSGNSNYNATSNTAMVTVTAATPPPTPVTPKLTITLSASSITTAQPLTVAVTVSGSGISAPVPTGMVTLTGGGVTTQTITLNSAGGASFTIPAGTLAVGADTLTVNYAGDSDYTAASNTSTVTVTMPPPTPTTPTLTITPSASSITTAQPLTVAVVVAGAGTSAPIPTGKVTLTGGGITAQTITLNSTGGASFTISAGSLAVGADTLTLSYSGDSNYTVASKTSTITVTNPPASESFTITGTAVTVAPGATTGNSSVITVTATPSCSCSVILTAAITSSPAGATSGPGEAQIQPVLSFGATSPVSLMSSNTGAATLTIYTVPPNSVIRASQDHKAPWLPVGGAALACVLLVGIPARRRRWQRMLGMVLLLAAFSAGMLGCISPLEGGTAPGTYIITVTGVSGTNTATGTVTLNVK